MISFYSKKTPKITLKDYIKRIVYYSEIEKNTLIYSLYLLLNLDKKYNIINYYTAHRLVLISIVVSAKFLEDVINTNTDFSKIGGVKLDSFNQMEFDFLCLNDFNINVNN